MFDAVPIYVCCHDDCLLPESDVLIPVQGGRGVSSLRLTMLGDDSGDNISFRNENYCELTVLYWIWRNTAEDCFGLCHYRRYFNLIDERTELDSFAEFAETNGYTKANIRRLMEQYDLILPRAKAKNNGASLYQLYKEAHVISDLDVALEIIGEYYPDMVSAARTAVFNQPFAYYKNMMIAKRFFADAYCRWLFDILQRIDCRIYAQLNLRSPYQRRVYGFLAERLFNIYLEYYRRHHSLRIKEVPLLVYSPSANTGKTA